MCLPSTTLLAVEGLDCGTLVFCDHCRAAVSHPGVQVGLVQSLHIEWFGLHGTL